jgi:uncharacterized membrane protein YfcA
MARRGAYLPRRLFFIFFRFLVVLSCAPAAHRPAACPPRNPRHRQVPLSTFAFAFAVAVAVVFAFAFAFAFGFGFGFGFVLEANVACR